MPHCVSHANLAEAVRGGHTVKESIPVLFARIRTSQLSGEECAVPACTIEV